VIDEATEIVELGANVDWILPNADQRGYYRWSIPDNMLAQLGEDAPTHLNVRERMGLLTNLWALLVADALDADDYLAAMRGISNDTDPSVLRALLDQLTNVRSTFITPELRPQFAAFLRELLAPTLERIGTESISGESAALEDLRPQIMLWLADYGGDETARAAISKITEQYLAGEIPSSDRVNVALRTASRWGDTKLFETYRARLEAATNPSERRTFILAVGSFRDPVVVQQILNYMLHGDVQPVDISTILFRLSAWEENKELLLPWAMENDAALRELLPEGPMAGAPALLMGCSTDNLTEIAEFYGTPERLVAGIERRISDAVATSTECAAFRQRELASVSSFLGGLQAE
jgi:alanyl aminopeptidase